ncbi:MAG: amidase family protein, partial [Actinomycetota bacterium]|nr:amidase family protein [Actinomycetota bacterium]
GLRLALSPLAAAVALDDDVADGLARALASLRALGAAITEPPPPAVSLAIGDDFIEVLNVELLVFHRRFDGRRDLYRPSLREWVDEAEARATTAERYVEAQRQRRETTAGFAQWLRDERISALIEPTVPCVAPLRGDGYERAGSDYELISLTHYWNWLGFPVVALPSGVGSRSGLPVSVSLIGPSGSDWELLDIGIQLQAELGVPDPYAGD